MEASTSADHESTSNTSMIEDAVPIEESLDFSSPWHFSDVVLVVEGTKFHVHKSTLSMWSPVFEAMFTSKFLESIAREIPLPGKRADEVKDLLKVIYSSWSKPKVTEENYQSLLQLADEYQMDRVKKLCSEFLVNKIQMSDCLDFFKLAEQFGLDDVREKCYEDVCYKSSTDLEGSEHFNGLEPELQVDICMRVIKELERTLEESWTTCSDLVKEVYKDVFMKKIGIFCGSSNPEEHIKRHKLQQTRLKNALAKAAIKRGTKKVIELGPLHDPNDFPMTFEFEFSCTHCIKEVQETQWKDVVNLSIIKQLVNKLYDLQQNTKIKRREEKKMADKLKKNSS